MVVFYQGKIFKHFKEKEKFKKNGRRVKYS